MLSEPAVSRARSAPALPAGVPVRVRNTLGSWSGGFEVVSVTPSGYLLRRVSDGYLLPTPIAAEGVLRA